MRIFFARRKLNSKKPGTPKIRFAVKKTFLEASYKVAYRIAKQTKPHSTGDTSVKPYALEIVELVRGLEERKNWKRFPRQMM
jgi:hypothetical protein